MLQLLFKTIINTELTERRDYLLLTSFTNMKLLLLLVFGTVLLVTELCTSAFPTSTFDLDTTLPSLIGETGETTTNFSSDGNEDIGVPMLEGIIIGIGDD
jgi:hypothetical protein